MITRCRRVATLGFCLSFAILLVAGIVGKDFLIESWWIYKLDSEILAEKLQAAQKLGERLFFRAIPKLIAFFKEHEREFINERSEFSQELLKAIIRIGPKGIAALFLAIQPETSLEFSWAFTVVNLQLLPGLFDCLDHPQEEVRFLASRSLGSRLPRLF